MANKRTIEIFSAGCPVCNETIEDIKKNSCPSCEITVLDMNDADVTARAKSLGIRSVPSVVINGAIADCCSGRGVDIDVLKRSGLGQPL